MSTSRTSPVLPGPARHGAALPLPTPAEVVELQAVRSYPAVSVLLTTTPAPVMNGVDAAKLSTLVDAATARVHDELGRRESRAVRGDLLRLADDAVTRPTRSAVALFAGGRRTSAWSLPVEVRDRAVVDPTFATRDLVRSLHRTPRHVVLVLGVHEARLFDGMGDTLLPAVGGAFPLRRDAVRQRSDRTDRPHRPARGARTQGGDRDGDLDAYLRLVDRALGTYLALHPAPLVVVGAPRTASRVTSLSRNTARLAGVIPGSRQRTPLPDLVALVRPVLEAYLRSRQAEALALLEARTGSGRVVSDMQAVWLAARTERPEMLAVEQGLFYPARLSADGDLLVPATDVEHPEVIDDAVDEVIETVLQRGGWVAMVEDGSLATFGRIALTVRDR